MWPGAEEVPGRAGTE